MFSLSGAVIFPHTVYYCVKWVTPTDQSVQLHNIWLVSFYLNPYTARILINFSLQHEHSATEKNYWTPCCTWHRGLVRHSSIFLGKHCSKFQNDWAMYFNWKWSMYLKSLDYRLWIKWLFQKHDLEDLPLHNVNKT